MVIFKNNFKVSILQEKEYVRLYVNHKNLNPRVKKNLGKGDKNDFLIVGSEIKLRLEEEFDSKEIDNNSVKDFVTYFIETNYKKTNSIYNYYESYLAEVGNRVNRKTKKSISPDSVLIYKREILLFKKYLTKQKIKPVPQNMNELTLSNFYLYVKHKKGLAHNSIVGSIKKVKNFIKYLDVEGLPVNPNYKKVTFNEEYEHLYDDDDDMALTREQLEELIMLKRKIDSNELDDKQFLKNYPDNIIDSIRINNLNMKKKGLKYSLDFWLWCSVTGMYYSDVDESDLILKPSLHGNDTVKYRRAKNDFLAHNIPFSKKDYYYILPELMKEYGIPNKNNFPINLAEGTIRGHLETISSLVGFDFKLKIKYARKTFASIMYYTHEVPIRYISMMLGHQYESTTRHYLRISDETAAQKINDLIK